MQQLSFSGSGFMAGSKAMAFASIAERDEAIEKMHRAGASIRQIRSTLRVGYRAAARICNGGVPEPKVTDASEPPLDVPAPVSNGEIVADIGKNLFALGPRDCRYIVARWSGEYRFCGERSFRNYSFCRTHCDVTFQPGNWSAEVA